MEDKKKKATKAPVFVKCPGRCGKMIRTDWGHACPPEREQRTDLVLEKVKVYIPEKDIEKRVDFLFVMMLTGLSHMLMAWGDLECKGGGCIDPKEQLFHCKACVMNGIRHHVDQAIERWKEKQ